MTTMIDPSAAPSPTEKERAEWLLLQAQIAQLHRQDRWEVPKAVAMITLALAALIASSRVADFWLPPRPQTIVVHFDQPLPAIRP